MTWPSPREADLRETQARAQEADRIGPDQERADQYEQENHS